MDGLRNSVGFPTAFVHFLRPILLAPLLIAELLFLTVCYDTQPLQSVHQWWGWPMSHARAIPQLGIAAMTGILLIGGRSLLRSLEERWSIEKLDPWANRCLIAHCTLFIAFALLTEQICKVSAEPTEFGVSAWMALALGISLTWIGALVSPLNWALILRQHAIPIGVGTVVGAIAWEVASFTSELWSILADTTLHLVATCLWLIGFEPMVEPAAHVVGTAAFQVEVSSACCGYEGIGLLWVFLTLHLIWFRRHLRFPVALILIPLGTVAMLAANILRITLLILIGDAGYPNLAIGGFHSQAGWIGFNIVALSMVALVRRSPIFWRSVEPALSNCSPTGLSVAAYLNPFLTIVAMSMLARALTNEPENLYPMRVLLSALALTLYRVEYYRLRWTVSGEAIVVGIIGAILWMALVKPGDAGSGFANHWPVTSAAGELWWVLRFLGSVVTVPISEELAFRGYFLCKLKSSSPATAAGAVGTSSFLFGLMHGNVVAGTLIGFLYAIIFLRRRSLGDSVAAHATTNAILAAYAISTSQWWLWS